MCPPLSFFTTVADTCNELYDSPQMNMDGASDSCFQAGDVALLGEFLPNMHKALHSKTKG